MPVRYLNRRRTRGVIGRRKSTTSRYRNTSRKARRTYRKPVRRMSKRAILNMTSRKKRDTMLTVTNITAAAQQASTSYTLSPAIITGGSNAKPPIVWCATGRGVVTQGGSIGTVFTDATRTATNCYMKGLSEKIEIQISDGTPWQWRRICFTYKGFLNVVPNIDGFQLSRSGTGESWSRLMNMLPNNTYKDAVEEIIFKGAINQDWNDQMIAPLDKSRITVKYDRTRTISSGNQDGVIRKFNLYHPMNKTLVYADDEQGGGKISSFYSVQSKAGMGDYIVMDYFRPRIGTTIANQLSFSSNATLYWHEK